MQQETDTTEVGQNGTVGQNVTPEDGSFTALVGEKPAKTRIRKNFVAPGLKPTGVGRRTVPPELWVLVRAVAEGRRLPMDQIANLTGIPKETLTTRSMRDEWETPKKMAKKAREQITSTVQGILDDVAGFIEEETTSDDLSTKAQMGTRNLLDLEIENGDCVTEEVPMDSLMGYPPEEPLRKRLETPAKFRPKDTDLLRPPTRATSKLRQLQVMAAGLEGHLKQMARTHQMAEAEITQAAMVYMSDACAADPSLAVLFAPSLEKLSKMARRNFKLESTDPLDGAKKVIEMSDPEFVAIPAPTVIDAELTEEENRKIPRSQLRGVLPD